MSRSPPATVPKPAGGSPPPDEPGDSSHLTAVCAWAGAATMFLIQPPADLWPAAWLAPLPWLALVTPDRLRGRRPWLTLWAAGIGHWLATIHWLRLPHPATSIGWVALSAYLGLYLPLFVAVARCLVHRRRWPLVPAAVLAWVSAEHVRGSFLGGFTFGGLGHTQWRWTALIQCADACGAIGVSAVVMAGAAGLAAPLVDPRRSVRLLRWDAGLAGITVAGALAYGAWRLAEPLPSGAASLDVLLVQGSIDTELKHDPDAAGAVTSHYDAITRAGLEAGPVDLVVWPETMWRWGLLEIDPAEELDEAIVERLEGAEPADADDGVRASRQARCRKALEQERFDALALYAARYATPWLVGVDKQVITPAVPTGVRHFNCALFLDPAGRPLDCYAKMHPVMFGEYVPLTDRFPWLQRLTPLPAGLTAGERPVAVTIAGWRVATNICYETALPEAVRSMVRDLSATGGQPDVIVNLTNDGWFWGSSELDMHLTAAIFRAVEVRTPVVIAANTGFSASIDGSGRLLACGPRRAPAPVRASVTRDGRPTPWLVAGSLPTWACVAVAAALCLEAVVRGGRRADRSGGTPQA